MMMAHESHDDKSESYNIYERRQETEDICNDPTVPPDLDPDPHTQVRYIEFVRIGLRKGALTRFARDRGATFLSVMFATVSSHTSLRDNTSISRRSERSSATKTHEKKVLDERMGLKAKGEDER